MTDLNQVKTNLPGYFEIISYSVTDLNLNSTSLIPAMRDSAIHTFGWPIGVVLEGHEEYKPIFTQKGIRALIDSKNGVLGASYDFWELTKKGEFYLLKSLFEDRRGDKLFYFDVRIKRITEALLRVGRLYNLLGVSNDKVIAIKFSYNGLKDRCLTAASSDFFIAFPRKCSISNFDYVLQASVSELTSNDYLTSKVIEICSELFLLFDGTVLSEDVYKKIISQFLSKAI